MTPRGRLVTDSRPSPSLLHLRSSETAAALPAAVSHFVSPAEAASFAEPVQRDELRLVARGAAWVAAENETAVPTRMTMTATLMDGARTVRERGATDGRPIHHPSALPADRSFLRNATGELTMPAKLAHRRGMEVDPSAS